MLCLSNRRYIGVSKNRESPLFGYIRQHVKKALVINLAICAENGGRSLLFSKFTGCSPKITTKRFFLLILFKNMLTFLINCFVTFGDQKNFAEHRLMGANMTRNNNKFEVNSIAA